MKKSLINILKNVLINSRRLTASARRMPDFVIIGTQKGGTTSLFYYLKQHPDTELSVAKEVHYYDFNYNKGLTWYKAHFPFKSNKKLTGEASPFYLIHPYVAERMHKDLPDAKVIVLLRDPVERAFSHYKMNIKNGKEKLSFEEAIEKEDERIADDVRKMQTDKNYFGQNYRLYSYISRGFYDEQIAGWFKYYSPDQIMIIKSEDFFDHTEEYVEKVLNFLGLERSDNLDFKNINKGKPGNIKPETREKLKKIYQPHNEKLSKLTGKSFVW